MVGGGGGREGMGFTHQRHLLSLVSKRMHAKHYWWVVAHPRKGGDQQVGGEAGVSGR